jgi:hypothetical protein
MSSNDRHVAIQARLAIGGLALLLTACTTSGAPTAAPSQPALLASQVATAPAASTVRTAGPVASSGGGATAGPIDPCSLLTQAEASGTIGVALGTGTSHQVGPDMVCTYAKSLSEVKVFLAPPTDPDTAKAYYDAHKSEIPAGAQITELPDLYDGSLIARGPNLDGIFVLDRNEFFELYCGNPACTDDALKSGADLIAGRL